MSHFDATNILSDDKYSEYKTFNKFDHPKQKPPYKQVGHLGEKSFKGTADKSKTNTEQKKFQHGTAHAAVEDGEFRERITKESLNGRKTSKMSNGMNMPSDSRVSTTNLRTQLEGKQSLNTQGITIKYKVSGEKTSLLPHSTPNGSVERNASKGISAEPLFKASESDVGETQTYVNTQNGQPYVRLLAISTSVLAVSLIVLLMLFIYKRRQSNISVISDAVYNEYKLNKKMESRSPLPSPRGSNQQEENSSPYDFIKIEDIPQEETYNAISSKTEYGSQPKETVYLELDESLRYDYAMPPETPDDDVFQYQCDINKS